MRNFNEVLPLILAREGGYINHPDDPGGPTNLGVTIAAYRRFIKRSGTIADLKKLTPTQAGKIFKSRYWDAVRADELPAGVDYSMADFAINSGPARATKEIQKLVGVVADGKLGPKTMAAILSHDPLRIIGSLNDARLVFMRNIKRGAKWEVFGVGWQRRVDDVRATSLALLDRAPPSTPEALDPIMPQERPTGLAAFFAAIMALFGGNK